PGKLFRFKGTQGKTGLVQRISVRCARELQHIQHFFQGTVRVVQNPCYLLLYLAQIGGDLQVLLRPKARWHRADKWAANLSQLGTAPIGNRGPYQQIPVSGYLCQQNAVGGQKKDKGGYTFLLAKGTAAAAQLFRKAVLVYIPPKVKMRRARKISGQAQRFRQ